MNDFLNSQIESKKAKIQTQENGILRLQHELNQKQQLLQTNIGALEQLRADLQELQEHQQKCSPTA